VCSSDLKQIVEYCAKYDICENDELKTATVLDPRFKKFDWDFRGG
jgi:hypothetical protein